MLIDDFNDAMGAWVDQNSPVIHDRIAVGCRAVFPRYFVISDAAIGQFGADTYFALIAVGRMSAFGNVTAETGTAGLRDATGRRTGSSTHGSADRPTDCATDDGTSDSSTSRPVLRHCGRQESQRRDCDSGS